MCACAQDAEFKCCESLETGDRVLFGNLHLLKPKSICVCSVEECLGSWTAKLYPPSDGRKVSLVSYLRQYFAHSCRFKLCQFQLYLSFQVCRPCSYFEQVFGDLLCLSICWFVCCYDCQCTQRFGSHIHACLPFETFWFSQQKGLVELQMNFTVVVRWLVFYPDITQEELAQKLS